MSKRIELPRGGHAVLRERLSYEQGRSVRLAFLRMKQDETAMADLDLALVKAYTESWKADDVDGRDVPLDTPELAADDVIQDVSVAALDLWKGKPDTKGRGAGKSPSTLRAVG